MDTSSIEMNSNLFVTNLLSIYWLATKTVFALVLLPEPHRSEEMFAFFSSFTVGSLDKGNCVLIYLCHLWLVELTLFILWGHGCLGN